MSTLHSDTSADLHCTEVLEKDSILDTLRVQQARTDTQPFPSYFYPGDKEYTITASLDGCPIPLHMYGTFPFPLYRFNEYISTNKLAQASDQAALQFIAAQPLFCNFITLLPPLQALFTARPSTQSYQLLAQRRAEVEVQLKKISKSTDSNKQADILYLLDYATRIDQELKRLEQLATVFESQQWNLHQTTLDISYFYLRLHHLTRVSSALTVADQSSQHSTAMDIDQPSNSETESQKRIRVADAMMQKELRDIESCFATDCATQLDLARDNIAAEGYVRLSNFDRVQLTELEKKLKRATLSFIHALESWLLNVYEIPKEVHPFLLCYEGDAALHIPHEITTCNKNAQERYYACQAALQQLRQRAQPGDWVPARCDADCQLPEISECIIDRLTSLSAFVRIDARIHAGNATDDLFKQMCRYEQGRSLETDFFRQRAADISIRGFAGDQQIFFVDPQTHKEESLICFSLHTM